MFHQSHPEKSALIDPNNEHKLWSSTLCSVYMYDFSLALCYFLSELHSEFGTQISQQNFHAVCIELRNNSKYLCAIFIYLHKIEYT
jgi:hypothetical protein